jgi:hypothetical protein
MAAAINREEAEACSAPGIPAISLDYDGCDVVRAGAPNSLIFTALMLQSFEGSARDLIDLLEETVMAWHSAQAQEQAPITLQSSGRAL